VFRFSPRPNRAAEIAWRPFGAEAFDEARRLGRPVLLSVGASWCHWCHVMDETAYSADAVLRLLARRYVAVRVDRDLRPDVDRAYNRGGWPTTCILNAAGAVLWGATYVPPEVLVRVLEVVADRYAADPGLAEAVAPAPVPGVVQPPTQGAAGARSALAEGVLMAAAAEEDRAHGGFGREGAKFPLPEVLAFLATLAPWPGERGRAAEAMLARALDGMLAGDLEDGAEGGFYRYATRPDWTLPHYEKMLADNAALAEVYLLQAARTARPRWRKAGEGALAFLERRLWLDGEGAYAGSQDADEAYARAGERERAALAPPAVDRAVYLDANAAAVECDMAAWAALGEEAWRDRATSLWDGLVRRLHRPGRGFAHVDAGAGPELFGESDDLAAALCALSALAPLGREEDAALARVLVDRLLGHHLDGAGRVTAAADDRPEEDLPPAMRGRGRAPAPGASGRAALALLRLGRQLGEGGWEEAAHRILLAWAADAPSLGVFGAALGRAAAEARPPLEVRVAAGGAGPGAPAGSGPAVLAFWAAARRTGTEPAVLRTVGPEEAAAEGWGTGEPRAFACLEGACGPPAATPAELDGTVRALVAGAAPDAVW
jgi:uncharacterized protein YyaL (SSP411 family)